MFCGLVVVVVGCEPGVVVACEAGVVVAAMVVGLSVESSSGSGGTNRPPRVLPTNTDLEGGGSGGGRGAVTTRGTAPCTNGGSARTSKELPSSSPSNSDVRGGAADSGRELSCRLSDGFFLGLSRLGLSDCALGGRM